MSVTQIPIFIDVLICPSPPYENKERPAVVKLRFCNGKTPS